MAEVESDTCGAGSCFSVLENYMRRELSNRFGYKLDDISSADYSYYLSICKNRDSPEMVIDKYNLQNPVLIQYQIH